MAIILNREAPQGASQHRKGAGRLACLAALIPLVAPAPAQAQILGPRITDGERSDIRAPVAPPVAPAGRLATPSRVEATALPEVAIADVAVLGAAGLGTEALRPVLHPFVGRKIGTDTLSALSTAVSDAYRQAGFALYGVVVPEQDFARGLVVVRVVEGQVEEIAFEGDTEGADFSLLRAYADRIIAERPLRQSTLDRYILLMQDVAGRKLQTRLELLPKPGAVKLVVSVQRTSVRIGLGVDNLGAGILGHVQGAVSATANSMLREGDSTRLSYGAPSDFHRFTFLSARHQQAIGSDGLTLAGSFGYLRTRPVSDSTLDGTAYTFGLQAVYPLIRRPRETAQVFGAFDILDSHSLAFGQLISNEATRVVRLGGAYARVNEADTRVGTITGIISQGINAMGARQRLGFYYGQPEFTKLSLQASLQQDLWPRRLILRLRASAQYAGDRLPASELFTYGGVTLGRGFDTATLFGDRAVGGSATLALPFRPMLTEEAVGRVLGNTVGAMLLGTEFYGFVDAARVASLSPVRAPRGDRASAAGFGFRVPIMAETKLDIEIAKPIVTPLHTRVSEDWRFVFVARRDF